MKNFTKPELIELNINETANGIFDTWFETWFIHNDSDNHCKKPADPVDPDTPAVPAEKQHS